MFINDARRHASGATRDTTSEPHPNMGGASEDLAWGSPYDAQQDNKVSLASPNTTSSNTKNNELLPADGADSKSHEVAKNKDASVSKAKQSRSHERNVVYNSHMTEVNIISDVPILQNIDHSSSPAQDVIDKAQNLEHSSSLAQNVIDNTQNTEHCNSHAQDVADITHTTTVTRDTAHTKGKGLNVLEKIKKHTMSTRLSKSRQTTHV